MLVKPYIMTLTAESEVFPTFRHDGIELLFMLKGEVTYRHGDQLFHLWLGDNLVFDADTPEVLNKLPACYVSVIAYRQG